MGGGKAFASWKRQKSAAEIQWPIDWMTATLSDGWQ